MAVTKDVSEEEVVVSPVGELPLPFDLTPASDPPEVEPVISLNALTGFSLPRPSSYLVTFRAEKSSSLWTVVAPIILFIDALPKKSIVTFVSSIIFKS